MRKNYGYFASLLSFMAVILLAACQSEVTPTPAVPAATLAVQEDADVDAVAAIPPTWTVVAVEVSPTATPAPTQPPPATSTPIPTATFPPTSTPTATATITPTATATAVPPTSPPQQPTAPPPPPSQPTVSANPTLGQNLLANGSFEGGWYNQNGIPELQLPNGWQFGYEEGTNPFDSSPVQNFVRPETRVLSDAFLPPAEHPLYILDGLHTIKMFKGYGATHFWLYQDVALDAGVYVFEINVYPDMVVDFVDGRKVFPNDPSAAEVRFIVGSGGSGWLFPAYGVMNELTHSFTLDAPTTIRVGVAFRGRYAIDNNGWFADNWSLRKVEG